MGIYRFTWKDLVPCIYDKVDEEFHNGFAAVAIDDKWSFVDIYGNMIGSSNYHSVNSFSEGMAAVSIDKKWGFIDEVVTKLFLSFMIKWNLFQKD